MLKHPIISILILCAVHISSMSLLHAGDHVSPPPEPRQSSALPLTDEEPERDSSLQKELAPPKEAGGIGVHSYVRESDKAEITEYSSHGRVFRVKVQPAGGFPAYYLEDSDGDGSFNKRLPGGNKRINPPMWVIQKF
ncbi:MAG: DUF2782 domain-containing protein [Mariprofundaceae bacterium]